MYEICKQRHKEDEPVTKNKVIKTQPSFQKTQLFKVLALVAPVALVALMVPVVAHISLDCVIQCGANSVRKLVL